MSEALDRLFKLEERYSKYSFVVILPTGIAMLASLGNAKLVEIFGLITLVLGHVLLGVQLGRRRMSGEKRVVLNLVFWEIALLAIILGWVLVFGWKEKPPGWIFVGIGVAGVILALIVRPQKQASTQPLPTEEE